VCACDGSVRARVATALLGDRSTERPLDEDMFSRASVKLNARAVLALLLALVAALAPGANATKGKWVKHKSHGDWTPCSDGWWGAMRANKAVRAENRRVLSCLITSCHPELKACAHDSTCRRTTRCLSDCRDEGRECAFDCIKTYDGLNNDQVTALGKCGIENSCMRSP